MKKQIVWGVALAAIAAVLLAVVWQSFVSPDARPVASSPHDADQTAREGKSSPCVAVSSGSGQVLDREGIVDRAGANESNGGRVETVDQAEEERTAEEEKAVDEFDGLTDKWMKPSKTGVSMSDVDGFVKAFRKISKGRRDECIHRALNLIPDENVMLLTGVLMDRRMDKEIVKTVFTDILNRSDEVKKPILQEIFKDKTHPCCSDAEWIFEVTGEKPE